MNPEDPTALDEQCADLLAACHEAHAAGASPTSPNIPPELRERLERNLACLRLLDQALPPAPGPATPSPNTAGPDESPTPPVIGRFQVRRELGRGGFGVVFLAHDPQLGRDVAVKVPRAEALLEPEQRGRFLREARAAAGLEHPNLVPVYEAGEVGPVCYIASAYCPGPSLDAWLKTRTEPVPWPEAAALVAVLADAVQHAHDRGVLHRDLKPANILLQISDIRLQIADGSDKSAISDLQSAIPKITDFGLAKLRDDAAPGQTQSGAILGTPSYMAPEQAAGKSRALGPEADVYSLGAILYEVLTGRPPFKADTVVDMLEQVRSQEPVAPGRLRPKLPRDLETICLKCLQKEPGRRYRSAGDLAADLRRLLAGEPIRARPIGVVERGWRWGRRHPAAAVLAASVLVALLLGASGLTVAFFREQRLKVEAQQKADALDVSLYFQRIAFVDHMLAINDLTRVDELLEKCPPRLRSWEWYYLQRWSRSTPFTDLPANSTPEMVWSVAVSPDGKLVAAGQTGGIVRTWDLASRRVVRTVYGPWEGVGPVAFSPDGRFLASGNTAGTLQVRETATGTLVFDVRAHRLSLQEVLYSPDGQLLLSGSEDGTAKLWEAATGHEVRTLRGHPYWVYAAAFSPDGRRVVTSSLDGTAKVWDVATGTELLTFTGHRSGVPCVAFSPDGRRVASGSWDQTVQVWDPDTGTVERTLVGHTSAVRSVTFSPDGSRLFSGDSRGSIKLWDTSSGEELLTLRGHKGFVRRLAFTPDGRQLLSAGFDRTVKVWGATPPDARVSFEVLTLRDHRAPVMALALDATGAHMASGGEDGKVLLWDGDGHLLRTLAGHSGPVEGVALSSDGRLVASAGRDKVARVWDATTGQVLHTITAADWMSDVAFSPDGRLLAVARRDFGGETGIRLWATATWEELPTRFADSVGELTSLAFSPDGRFLAAGLPPGQGQTFYRVQVWEGATGRVVQTLPAEGNDVAFSPDGRQLACAGGIRSLCLFDLDTGKELRQFPHSSAVLSVAFHPDGKRLATGDQEGGVRVWDASTGRLLRSYHGHARTVANVAFTPDGRRLVSASYDQTIRIWDASLSLEEWYGEEARALVEDRFKKLLDKEEVLASLRGDAALGDDLRRVALQLAGSYEESPFEMDNANWDVVKVPGGKAEDYAVALRRAEKVRRLVPDHPAYLTTLVAAQFRAGKFAEVLATFPITERLHADDPLGQIPSDWAFRAMAEHLLGQTDQARATLARLRELMKEPRWAHHQEATAFLGEAEALLQTPPSATGRKR
jgi:WD40 repeat protein